MSVEALFDTYTEQTYCTTYKILNHSDGHDDWHIDGENEDRHTDKHQDHPNGW